MSAWVKNMKKTLFGTSSCRTTCMYSHIMLYISEIKTAYQIIYAYFRCFRVACKDTNLPC